MGVLFCRSWFSVFLGGGVWGCSLEYRLLLLWGIRTGWGVRSHTNRGGLGVGVGYCGNPKGTGRVGVLLGECVWWTVGERVWAQLERSCEGFVDGGGAVEMLHWASLWSGRLSHLGVLVRVGGQGGAVLGCGVTARLSVFCIREVWRAGGGHW